MRRILICSGVLGGGTALVFALAALTATLFPHGTLVQNQWGGWGGPVMMDDVRPMPAIQAPDVFLGEDGFDEGKP
jgi:hypothetical protein